MKPENKVNIELTSDEALVFFDWLARLNNGEHSDLFVDQAEERVLFDLESFLEKKLSSILQADYLGLLSSARNALRDESSE